MSICEGRAQDAGGVNVVESASVVVGCSAPPCPKLFAGHTGVWRARRWLGDMLDGLANVTTPRARTIYGFDTLWC
jgi:hypothetical protein